MVKSSSRGDISEARMLTIDQACAYTGMGKTSCRNWCEEIGAVRRFGRMVRYDKMVIDKVYEQMNRDRSRKSASDCNNKPTDNASRIARAMYEDPDIQELL